MGCPTSAKRSVSSFAEFPGGISVFLLGNYVSPKVLALVEPLVAAHGVELVDVEWASSPHGKILRVTIDNDNGVTVDNCIALSRDISTALDVEELIAEKYSLEVSSPGLDRALKVARDFERQIGRMAKAKLIAPAADGQMALRGTIEAVDGDVLRLNVDGNICETTVDNIREAKLVFDIPSQPKKQNNRRKKNR